MTKIKNTIIILSVNTLFIVQKKKFVNINMKRNVQSKFSRKSKKREKKIMNILFYYAKLINLVFFFFENKSNNLFDSNIKINKIK